MARDDAAAGTISNQGGASSRRYGRSRFIARSQAVVRQWPKVAIGLKISAREQERIADAFRLAG